MPSTPATFTGVLTTPGAGSPPGIWGPTDPRPQPPIYLLPPDAIAPGVPAHPIYIPVYPAHPIVLPPSSIAPGVPAHPIALPPGIWGPTDPRPTHPIVLPPGWLGNGTPSHPIYLPPYVDNTLPPHVDNSLPGDQPGIWGPTDPRPSHPIVIPPDLLGPGVPAHPIFLPPGIWGPNDPLPTPPIHIPPGSLGPCLPTHPIVLPPLPIPPLTPTNPIVLPDDDRPEPEHPIVLPPPGSGFVPAHPIVIPPDFVSPGVPAHPIYIPGPAPSHPIVLPGEDGWPDPAPPDLEIPPFPGGPTAPGVVQPVAGIPGPNGMLVFYWSPVYGWIAVPAGGPGSVGGDDGGRRPRTAKA